MLAAHSQCVLHCKLSHFCVFTLFISISSVCNNQITYKNSLTRLLLVVNLSMQYLEIAFYKSRRTEISVSQLNVDTAISVSQLPCVGQSYMLCSSGKSLVKQYPSHMCCLIMRPSMWAVLSRFLSNSISIRFDDGQTNFGLQLKLYMEE